MKKITEISGGIALLIYRQQRLTPNDMEFRGFTFRYDHAQWKDEPKYDKFQQSLLDVAGSSLTDLQNAIEYLHDAGLMTFVVEGNLSGQKEYRNFHLNAKGIHVIEDVDNEPPEVKNQFNVTFNFNLESLAKIEPTLKAKFGLINL